MEKIELVQKPLKNHSPPACAFGFAPPESKGLSTAFAVDVREFAGREFDPWVISMKAMKVS